jgi:signal transduction histidine kinase
VVGEPELLRTMVENLLRNAVRFTKRGGLVRLDAGVDGAAVRIRVRDEGPCIPPENLEKIFHDFAQSGPDHGRGHGLGLAIARGVAEMHGGRVEAANADGGGCVFTITLPLTGATEPSAQDEARRR